MLSAAPSLCGNAQADAHLLESYIQTGEVLLRSLGPKSQRTERDRRTAAATHERCRGLRRQFMALHADWLYSALTNGRTIRKTISELAYAAAEYCPGLTPGAAQIAAE